MRLLLVFLLLFPTLVAADSPAAADKQPIFALGMGSQTSCGQFIAASEGRTLNTHLEMHYNGVKYVSENEAMIQYAFGVLTGINFARDREHQIQHDNAAISLWLRNWCTKNPTSTLLDAISALAAQAPGTPLK